jgi:hypothetical protein
VKARTLAAIAAAAALAAGLALAFFWVKSPRATRVQVGSTAPDVELAWVEPVGSGHLLAVPAPATIIGFFDSTSEPGRLSARALEAVQQRFRAYRLVVVGVAMDSDRRDALALIRKTPVTFLAFHDPGGERVRPQWGDVKVGEAYLIGPDRKVVQVFPDGFGWPDKDLRETLLRILPPPLGEQKR